MESQRRSSPLEWLRVLFGFRAPVGQNVYLAVGVALMLTKYAVEWATIRNLTGKIYTPLDFVNPLLSSRAYFTTDAPEWFGMGWVLWTLPFLWIAITMSVRRAADIGISPWFGMVVLVPFVNVLGMLVLAALPAGLVAPWSEEQRESDQQRAEQIQRAWRPPSTTAPPPKLATAGPPHPVFSAFLGLAAGAGFLIGIVLLSVYVLESYGAVMFFGSPIVTGAVSAYALNATAPRGLGLTLVHAVVTVAVACLAFLLFGIEGAICIAMAIPIMAPLAIAGALVGYAIATQLRRPARSEHPGLIGCAVLLPAIALAESRIEPLPTIEVMTPMVIDAPPQRVWQHVIDFPDIEAEPEWLFQLGIASPERARIAGSGVGAIRYCEFTTGTFVEPITVWDAPHRLAFDVTDQPEPMFELTPYRHIHPPHLDGSFRSLRGEFRLIGLADGRTRLEGRTWYQLRIHPLSYWTIWTDRIVHRIHLRVLQHIKELSEAHA